jgi:hypothetical protein
MQGIRIRASMENLIICGKALISLQKIMAIIPTACRDLMVILS